MGCKQSNKKVAAPTSSTDGFRNGRNRRGESKVAAKKNEFVSNTFPQKSVGLVQGDRKISWLLCPKSAKRRTMADCWFPTLGIITEVARMKYPSAAAVNVTPRPSSPREQREIHTKHADDAG